MSQIVNSRIFRERIDHVDDLEVSESWSVFQTEAAVAGEVKQSIFLKCHSAVVESINAAFVCERKRACLKTPTVDTEYFKPCHSPLLCFLLI